MGTDDAGSAAASSVNCSLGRSSASGRRNGRMPVIDTPIHDLARFAAERPLERDDLYHYTSATVGLDSILAQMQFRLGLLEATNDPRESRPRYPNLSLAHGVARGDPEAVWKEADLYLRRSAKVACFTIDYALPDWALEADRMRGYAHPGLWAVEASAAHDQARDFSAPILARLHELIERVRAGVDPLPGVRAERVSRSLAIPPADRARKAGVPTYESEYDAGEMLVLTSQTPQIEFVAGVGLQALIANRLRLHAVFSTRELGSPDPETEIWRIRWECEGDLAGLLHVSCGVTRVRARD